MMLRKSIYTLFLILICSCGVGESIKKGDKKAELGEYFEASKQYQKAYNRIKPKERVKRGEIAFKMGAMYEKSNQLIRAKAAFTNAIRYQYKDSIVFFKQAETMRKSGEYKAASKVYETFLTHKPTDSLALIGLKSCIVAQEWKNNPTRYKVKKMDLFNYNRSDYSPVYASKENDQLYFTTTREKVKGTDLNGITGQKSADLITAKKDEKKQWQAPQLIESEINTEFEEGACSITSDGSTLYFTRCKRDPTFSTTAEIYVSQRSGASWGTAQKCEITKDSTALLAHPSISPDGQFLYFVSDMSGGYGGKDIWRIAVSNGSFGYLENLGPTINTPGDELFPTMRTDSLLYFSSNGRIGMGGLDIFKATRIKDQVWQVENMRSPINSAADDFGITFETGAEAGFFSSNRGDARGWDHIYAFDYPTIKHVVTGWVFDKEGDAVPDALVQFVGKDGTNEKINVKIDGSFTHLVTPGMNYVMLASSRGYLNNKQELIADTIQENRAYEVEFPLSSITKPVRIENIFYEFDKADLTPESTEALTGLVKLLLDNPTITIELGSHCDYKGPAEYNQKLAQRRAEAVVDFLIKGTIEPARLTAKGYGESEPKVVNKRMAKAYDFLKEGDILTESFILALTPEQQEICNGINRRTEFKVIRTTYKLYE